MKHNPAPWPQNHLTFANQDYEAAAFNNMPWQPGVKTTASRPESIGQESDAASCGDFCM
jgi:hypothetical protein